MFKDLSQKLWSHQYPLRQVGFCYAINQCTKCRYLDVLHMKHIHGYHKFSTVSNLRSQKSISLFFSFCFPILSLTFIHFTIAQSPNSQAPISQFMFFSPFSANAISLFQALNVVARAAAWDGWITSGQTSNMEVLRKKKITSFALSTRT